MKNAQLDGADFLLKKMEDFGPTVSKKARDQGIRKALVIMRRGIKAKAPVGTGRLRQNIGFRYSRKSGLGWVGLRPRKKYTGKGRSGGLNFYKTLDFGRQGGGPLNPWFLDAVEGVKDPAVSTVIKETTAALYSESVKIYRSSRARNQRAISPRNRNAFGSR